MGAIDRHIHLAHALLVEGNSVLRSVTAGQLRDVGIGQVTAVGRIREARMQLEQRRFEIVVCSREFEGSADNGQDLLDELRREKLIPHSTVFLMVTHQATYHQVVEAAESALDGLLVRPYTTTALFERLQEARHRKRELADVLKALDSGDQEAALMHAVKRFQDQAPFAGWCGRLAAELLMEMDRPAEARKLFELLHAQRPSSWALLGTARALTAAGDISAARKSLAEVLRQDPACADARDLQGRLYVEQGDFEAALGEYRAAAELTAGCVLRTQHAGALAFYQGHKADARRWLEQSQNLGAQSKLFDALSLLLLAMLRFDDGDSAGVVTAHAQLQRYRERFPESRRLRWLDESAAWLVKLQAGDDAASLASLIELSQRTARDDFDLEAANVLLSMWSRLPENARASEAHQGTVQQIAERFCIAKATAEVLVAAAQRSEPALSIIRRCQAEVSALTESAMSQAMKGQAETAVLSLLTAGERTKNAKLLDMAAAIARRHADVIPAAEAHIDRAAQCLRNSCHAMTHIAGIQRSGRAPGALQLRSHAAG